MDASEATGKASDNPSHKVIGTSDNSGIQLWVVFDRVGSLGSLVSSSSLPCSEMDSEEEWSAETVRVPTGLRTGLTLEGA